MPDDVTLDPVPVAPEDLETPAQAEEREARERIAVLREQLAERRRQEQVDVTQRAHEDKMRSLASEEERLMRELAEANGEPAPEDLAEVTEQPVVTGPTTPQRFDLGGGVVLTEQPAPSPDSNADDEPADPEVDDK